MVKTSAFLGLERGLEDEEVVVLMSELSWEVKERVVEEEISLPPASLRGRGWL